MKANWKECQLGDCVTLLSGGTPSKSRNDYWDGDLPWVSCKDMKLDRIYDAQDHLSPLGAKNGTRVVPENTILFVVRGMILANSFPVAITKRPVAFNQDLKAVTCADFVETEFLYYWLKANSYEILGRADEAGHGTKRIQTDRLLSLPIRIPSPLVQRRIAGILSAYDDLIENNQRRIKILEEMARSLYREWFIHFRFPTGNEPSLGSSSHPLPMGEGWGEGAVKLVGSPLGPIPQGWEVKKLGDLTALLNRGISPTYDDEGGDSKVINQKCIRDQRLSLEPARRQSKPITPDKCIRFGDVLINSTGVGTLGRVAQVYEDLDQCTVDTHVTIVRPKADTDVDFFGCALLLKQEDFERLGIGATGQTELSRTAIGEVKIPAPPDSLQKYFGTFAHPMRTAANTLSKQTKNLRRTRDLLLPRLLSGAIELSNVGTSGTQEIA